MTRPSSLRAHRWLAASTVVCACSAAAQGVTERVEIIGNSPLPGQGIDRNRLPYTTQVLRRGDMDDAQAGPLTDQLSRQMTGVQVNDIQGSPFQGDLTFRGFRASGLLGASQGLSVYLDGVRINEPFGDVIQWDLVPEFALHSVALVPAANPAFGLNTLGGAISLTTADGRNTPGWRGEASIGSFGRKRISVSHGGADGDWQHYLGVGAFDENGWRDHSPGRLATLFGKLGRSTDAGDFGLSALVGRSDLRGNGLVPLDTYDDPRVRTPDIGAADRAAVYTHPDEGRSRLFQLSATWRYAVDARSTLEALVYTRHSRRRTINGDLADEGSDTEAALNGSQTRQRGNGLSLGWSSGIDTHEWQLGATLDRASVRYRQSEQEAEFDATRGVQAVPGDAELSAQVEGQSSTLGLYATGTWQLAATTHLTTTLRFNRTQVGNTLTTVDDATGDVDTQPHERFTYRSWNPAIGIAQRIGGGATLFANVARNSRVPTVIELGCADPESPCRLPAGLQSDPYLKPVRSTSVEGGVRFGAGRGVKGSLTLYRTDNRDDILFSSISATGQLGYFRNVDSTRHQGVDAELQGSLALWDLRLAYSYLDATYQADGTLRIGERNVAVGRGTRIAGLPRHQLKLSVDRPIGAGFSVGADWQVLASRVTSGNEDGRFSDDDPARADFRVPGYTLFNVRASWQPPSQPGLQGFVQISNLFNRRYASFGNLAETRFSATGQYTGVGRNALFVAPGAPRALLVGLRFRF